MGITRQSEFLNQLMSRPLELILSCSGGFYLGRLDTSH